MEDYPLAVAPCISMELSGDLERTRELVELGYQESVKVWPKIEAALGYSRGRS
jgi:hypothetical protein